MNRAAKPATKENAASLCAFALHCLNQSQHHCPPEFTARRLNLEMDAEGAVESVFEYLDTHKGELP